jgi:hypothetical protein
MVAVTLENDAEPALALLKLPDNATVPPGVSPLDADVCTTVTLVALAVVAEPVPDPALVQYANAAVAMIAMIARPPVVARNLFLFSANRIGSLHSTTVVKIEIPTPPRDSRSSKLSVLRKDSPCAYRRKRRASHSVQTQ